MTKPYKVPLRARNRTQAYINLAKKTGYGAADPNSGMNTLLIALILAIADAGLETKALGSDK